MSEVAHQPPRMLRDVRTCLEKKSSFASVRDDRHALVVRCERRAHVDAEDRELHADERERHADRQEQEQRGRGRRAKRTTISESSIQRPLILPRRASQVLDAEVVEVQALEGQQREEEPALLARDERREPRRSRRPLRGTRWCRARCPGPCRRGSGSRGGAMCFVVPPRVAHARRRRSRGSGRDGRLPGPTRGSGGALASCDRKATWVSTMPSAAAMSSWNQMSPSRMKPVTHPPKASRIAPPTAA